MNDTTTTRERIADLLRHAAYSALHLSQLVGIPEHDVAEHLEHIDRSLPHRGERLEVQPPKCQACGFVFRERRRFSKPGSCPECRHTRITRPLFSIGPGPKTRPKKKTGGQEI